MNQNRDEPKNPKNNLVKYSSRSTVLSQKSQYHHLRNLSDPEFFFLLPNQKTSFSPSHPGIFLTTQQINHDSKPPALSRASSKLSKLPTKRELSPDEQNEIEKLVQNKLTARLASLKSSVSRKISLKSSQNVLKNDINLLRADTLASVQAIQLEKKILPQLRKEALSEVLFKRRNSKTYNKRELVLAEMEDLLVKKNNFVPTKLFQEGTERKIEEACKEAQNSLKIYAVKPLPSKILQINK